MKRNRWKWIAGIAACLLAVAVAADAVRGMFYRKPIPAAEQAEGLRMRQRFDAAGGDSRRVMAQMQEDRRRERREALLKNLTPAQLKAVKARMARIFKRTGGDNDKLTPEEQRFIRPYMDAGFTLELPPQPGPGKRKAASQSPRLKEPTASRGQ
jgi:hypothetical protein